MTPLQRLVAADVDVGYGYFINFPAGPPLLPVIDLSQNRVNKFIESCAESLLEVCFCENVWLVFFEMVSLFIFNHFFVFISPFALEMDF